MDKNGPNKPYRRRWFLLRGESMIASTGLMLAAILLLAMGSSAYWTLRVQQETAASADTARIQGLGDLLSETASLMLAVDEVSAVRRLIADVGIAGIILRADNISDSQQLRTLTADLQ